MAEQKNNSQVSAAPQTETRSPASQTTNGAAGNAAQSGKQIGQTGGNQRAA